MATDHLVQQLQLRRVGDDSFRGASVDAGTPALFGGQVLAQGLVAAGATVDEHVTHSLHAYFLRPGDKAHAVTYEVDRLRDGTGFSSRQVVALQGRRAILHMLVSFQRRESGVEHQCQMPPTVAPEHSHPAWDSGTVECPIEYRLAQPESERLSLLGQPRIWLRSCRLPDSPLVHQAVLAYASDHSLLSLALAPHRLGFNEPGVKAVSIDHAIWFHREFRCDEWLLYARESPTAANARGFCRGSIFTRDGRLVASVVQEGLIRVEGMANTER